MTSVLVNLNSYGGLVAKTLDSAGEGEWASYPERVRKEWWKKTALVEPEVSLRLALPRPRGLQRLASERLMSPSLKCFSSTHDPSKWLSLKQTTLYSTLCAKKHEMHMCFGVTHHCNSVSISLKNKSSLSKYTLLIVAKLSSFMRMGAGRDKQHWRLQGHGREGGTTVPRIGCVNFQKSQVNACVQSHNSA